MKSYIPHQILIINEQIETNEKDKGFMNCMERAFSFANEMGLRGKRVCGLRLQKPGDKNYDPLNARMILWCQIECTIEERENWEKNRENHMSQYIIDLLQ